MVSKKFKSEKYKSKIFLNQKNRWPEIGIWSAITLLTGLIYTTLAIVPVIRKFLTESFGYGIYNQLYWIFLLAAAIVTWQIFKRSQTKKERIKKFWKMIILIAIYAYFISDMKYAVEKVHFIEYGALGFLAFFAFKMRFDKFRAVLWSVCFVYWIGLGDEGIQFLLPNRVGEFRDSLLNGLSGILGLAIPAWVFAKKIRHYGPSKKSLPLMPLVLTIGFTVLFISSVHGFGYRYTFFHTGRFYSSLTHKDFLKKASGERLSKNKEKTYNNEALRHLFQRAFYRTNDFLAKDGSYYRLLNFSHWENEILLSHYPSFLKENRNESLENLLRTIDAGVALKAKGGPVVWGDSLRSFFKKKVNSNEPLYNSRVKSTIITEYKFKDLLFLAVVIWGILLAINKWVKESL